MIGVLSVTGFGILSRYTDLSEVFTESTPSVQYTSSDDISWWLVVTRWLQVIIVGGSMLICTFGVLLN